MAVLTLTISDNVRAELVKYADRRELTIADAGAYALAYGLVRLALFDREPDPDATLEDALDELVAAYVAAAAEAANDAKAAAARSPEAGKIGSRALAVALDAIRGNMTPAPTAEEAGALLRLDAGRPLTASDAAAVSGWLGRRQREAAG